MGGWRKQKSGCAGAGTGGVLWKAAEGPARISVHHRLLLTGVPQRGKYPDMVC
uniref:Uncharacterized protein n=1 Tax=uncultured Adhaeribacter sp. TaxID=448109 RepID=A0A6J4HSU1_9BACT|nr:MAG: hypothetical protein AVDCRST_MAG95-1047 [uncultured Adhaeribacter sp.]